MNIQKLNTKLNGQVQLSTLSSNNTFIERKDQLSTVNTYRNPVEIPQTYKSTLDNS